VSFAFVPFAPYAASMPSFLRRFLLLALLGTAVAGAAYVQSEGFSRKWCGFVREQFEKRGIHLTLDRLTLNPLEGLVARNVRIFQDEKHEVLLMEMDRLILDLDYSKMLRNELFLEGVDLRQADVSLPLDPENPRSEVIKVTDLNSRLFLVGDRLEVRKAEGTLFNLRISITGSLLKPQQKATHESPEEAKENRRKRLAAIYAQRNLIVETARLLKNFESADAPTLQIDVHGDMEKPEELTANLQLSANGLRHRTYLCEEMSITANYAGEAVDVSRFYVKDHLGTLESSAQWQLRGEHVDFHVRSTADLPGLLTALNANEALREVVFYEPVELVADGQYLLGKAVPPDALLPLQCVGSLHAKRFATRGVVMEGLEVSFGLSPEGWHFRDGLLSHETGTMSVQAMWRKAEGLRYKGVLQMDPNVLLPYINVPQTREVISRLELTQKSSFYIEFSGGGPELVPDKCRTEGKGEIRHFLYRGQEVARVTGDLDCTGPIQIFRNVHVERPDGLAQAAEVRIDHHKHTIQLVKVTSDVDPVAMVYCFAPNIAEIIAHYRLVETPEVKLDGIIYAMSPGTDLSVSFTSKGTGQYTLWEKDYTVQQPGGTLIFRNGQLQHDISGSVFNSPMRCRGTASLTPNVKDFTVSLSAGSFPYEVFGRPLPFRQVTADVTSKSGLMDYKIKSSVFDGSMILTGKMDDRDKAKPFNGELRLSGIEFKKFARVYSPENDTDGDITGHFNFKGRLNDWKALQGEGALTILNGNLYAVPILGPLTPLLGALLPRPMAGYNLAREADCTFKVADGFVTTDNFEALTGVFRLVAKGTVDFIEDRINFEAQAKVRGLPGLVFFPVSEILEYIGEGSVGEPLWRPRYFSASKEKSEFRKVEATPEMPAPTRKRSVASEAPAVKREPVEKPEVDPPKPAKSFNPFNRK
jgi:hypothetical protein